MLGSQRCSLCARQASKLSRTSIAYGHSSCISQLADLTLAIWPIFPWPQVHDQVRDCRQALPCPRKGGNMVSDICGARRSEEHV